MKIRTVSLALAALLVLAHFAAAATNPVPNDLDKTLRLVKGQRVDLKPLTLWLAEKKNSKTKSSATGRPLAAWKLVRVGRIIESSVHWIIEGTVDGAQETLVLQNPPKKELDEFNQLKGQHAQLLVRTNQLAQDLKRVAAARKQAASREQSLLRRRGGKWGAVAAVEQRAGALAADERGLSQELEATRQQLRQIEARGYDFKKPFTMDCLALKTGETLYGKPVYDRGVIFN